ncbi:MAG: flagellar filament capping protein FliD [Thiotrichales bacterium]
MATVGASSGLDVNSIVSSLMNLERKPLRDLDTKEQEINVKISGIGRLKAVLSDLKSATRDLTDEVKLGQFNATTSDEAVATATATSVKTSEMHEVNVISLATNHRMTSNAFDSPDAAIAAGTYTFGVGSDSFDIELDAASANLADLKDAINRSADNTGISAGIVNGEAGSFLVLTSRKSGADYQITAPDWFTETTAAQNAEIEVDGIRATPSSNSPSDVIPGLSLELKSVGQTTITTDANKSGMHELMQSFVDAYNNVISAMGTLKTGDLKGESSILSIESSLRTEFFSSVEDAFGNSSNAFEFGLTFDKEGTLSLDKEKFNKVVDQDIYKLLDFFSAENGFSNSLIDKIELYTNFEGTLTNRVDAFNSQKDRLHDSRDRLEYRMQLLESRYMKEFSSLDSLMSQMSTTSNYMSQQLAGLGSL